MILVHQTTHSDAAMVGEGRWIVAGLDALYGIRVKIQEWSIIIPVAVRTNTRQLETSTLDLGLCCKFLKYYL